MTLGGTSPPAGGFQTVDGERYYRISSCHRLPPFLMSLPSATDLWMFVASTGGLTAGRVDPDGSLFPYETVDRLLDGHHHTGPITLLRVRREGSDEVLWQPFSDGSGDDPRTERNLYKNTIGNRLIFEEIRPDLELEFRYRWSMSDEFGVVRTATLVNRARTPARIVMLDGLRNVLPFGAPLSLYQRSSCLVDAYKRTEYDPRTQLSIFSLTARVTDRPEPAEELRAATVWCHGLAPLDVCLSIDAVPAFRRGEPVSGENVLTGQRGNYLAVAPLELKPGASVKWHLVADTGRSHVQIAALEARLLQNKGLDGAIEDSLRMADETLLRIVASADGLALTGREEEDVHHFANVLFNNLRGGVFAKNHEIERPDLVDFIRTRNRAAAGRQETILDALPDGISVRDLHAIAWETGDADFERLCLEYLPLYFGRRHGDPSRPWNLFSIRVRDRAGRRVLHHEGNWRDIFQNWEALSHSFPGFLPGIIARFVNASTVDGFNPYRLTRDGVDWEVPDPADPWSHIGYWGDHQIVYLLRFLEALPRFSPGVLESLLRRDIFCYTDVPYRLRFYAEMITNPRATIVFDSEHASRIAGRVRISGTDGRLVQDSNGSVYHVNLLEKLLVPALSRLSSFVPGGGIWMNTQRPEWNDANNALVGNGCSMVTLCHLRRYLDFLAGTPDDPGGSTASLSHEVAEWFRRIGAILQTRRPLLSCRTLSDRDRMEFLDALGEAFSDYRRTVYARGFSGRSEVPIQEIVAFCRTAIEYLDHSIDANRREDGLYHSYNLIEISNDRTALAVRPLYEMLEGQVAALSSGVVSPAEAVRILAGLFEGRMYRRDRKGFLLYPEKRLPSFVERNSIPGESVMAVPLLRDLASAGDVSILARDALGTYRFNGDFSHARDVSEALDRLAGQTGWSERVEADRRRVLEVFEAVFDHKSFTGRSGTMYAYEGLGSIYWHMVAKLLLAVQEVAIHAVRSGEAAAVVDALVGDYYRIRAGLGFEKTVLEYGAFPTDPYSHTPARGGAQQPGMTGQVKEEILTRFGELGVHVDEGIVSFVPVLLRDVEFRRKAGTFHFIDIFGRRQTMEVPAGCLAFTYCQVPIVYERTGGEAWTQVTTAEGTPIRFSGSRLPADHSRSLLDRLGNVTRIHAGIPEASLRRDPNPTHERESVTASS